MLSIAENLTTAELQTNTYASSTLRRAIVFGDEQTIRNFIQSNDNVDQFVSNTTLLLTDLMLYSRASAFSDFIRQGQLGITQQTDPEDFLKAFLDAKVDLNKKDGEGNTAFHVIAKKDPELFFHFYFLFIEKYRIDVGILKNSRGETAWDIAWDRAMECSFAQAPEPSPLTPQRHLQRKCERAKKRAQAYSSRHEPVEHPPKRHSAKKLGSRSG